MPKTADSDSVDAKPQGSASSDHAQWMSDRGWMAIQLSIWVGIGVSIIGLVMDFYIKFNSWWDPELRPLRAFETTLGMWVVAGGCAILLASIAVLLGSYFQGRHA